MTLPRFLLLLFGIAVAAIWILPRGFSPPGDKPSEPLLVFCAAGMKQPISEIATQFQEEFGTEVQMQFGGSGTLITQASVAKQGDLLIVADSQAAEIVQQQGLAQEVLVLARQHVVIAVKQGNPKKIVQFTDLFREDVRFAIGNPETASIGKVTQRALEDRWEDFRRQASVMKPTVSEIAMDVVVGSVDAAIVWNTTVAQFTELEAVRIAEFKDLSESISATVLSTSKSPTDALRFARYLAARDRGSVVFERFGCEPTNGDVWAWKPEMILYSGGVNRPAIEPLLQEFSQREGVQMTTIFNGCGILCATMQTMKDSAPSQFPDAYYACDLCFVPPVAKQFPEAVLLTETEIGMIVPAGNPQNIRTLADLAQPDLRVGLCNQRQSTLGYMTAGMLRSAGLTDSVQKNVVVEVPTADFLINQMRSGALDAAIVYRVNAQLQADHLDFIKINHPGAKAVQPFSVAADSPRRQLAGRLLEFLKRHRREFEESGFSWRGDSVAVKSDQIEVPPWLRSPQALPEAVAQ